jgi:L-rhamnose mutarotase
MKQYAKTVLLKNDPELLAKYRAYHNEIWPEVVQSFKAVGVIDIQIWLIGRQLFMLMTTEDTFNPEKDLAHYLTLHPRNKEWEDLMTTFQERVPEAKPGEHWAELELIFQISKHF